MNNNRLATSVGSGPKINRELWISQAKLMLEGPSNYKRVGGKPSLYQKINDLLIEKM